MQIYVISAERQQRAPDGTRMPQPARRVADQMDALDTPGMGDHGSGTAFGFHR